MKKRTLCLRIFCLLLTVLTLNCSHIPSIQTDLDKQLNDIFQKESIILEDHSNAANIIDLTDISFFEALHLTIDRNLELKKIACAYGKSILDIEQSNRILWPRLTLEFSSKTPFGGDKDANDTVFSSGMVLHYDLLDAFFYKDVVSANEAIKDQLLEKKAFTIKKIYGDFRLLLSEIHLNHQKIQKLKKVLSITETAKKRMMIIKEKLPDSVLLLETLSDRVQTYKQKIYECRLVLRRLMQKRNTQLGFNNGVDISIVGDAAYFPQPEGYAVPERINSALIKQIWNQRNDLEIEKKNLLLAEINIIKSKRHRWPNISASMGLGAIYLDALNDKATFIPSIKMSYPLFDAGDAKRSINRSKKDRELAKLNLLTKMHDIVDELYTVFETLKIARQNVIHCKKALIKAKQEKTKKQALVNYNRADLLGFYNAQIMVYEKEIQYHNAIFNFRQAAINFSMTKGDVLPAKVTQKLKQTKPKQG